MSPSELGSQTHTHQIASCLGHMLKYGTAGRRLEAVYPTPTGTAPVPGRVVDL